MKTLRVVVYDYGSSLAYVPQWRGFSSLWFWGTYGYEVDTSFATLKEAIAFLREQAKSREIVVWER